MLNVPNQTYRKESKGEDLPLLLFGLVLLAFVPQGQGAVVVQAQDSGGQNPDAPVSPFDPAVGGVLHVTAVRP